MYILNSAILVLSNLLFPVPNNCYKVKARASVVVFIVVH